MIDSLSAIGTRVDDYAETVVEMLLLGDFVRGEKELTQKIGIGGRRVREGGDVSLGDDQDMHRRLWMDVGKREHVIVLIKTRDGDCACGDFAEEAVRNCSHVGMLTRGGYFLKYFGCIPGDHGL